MLFQASSRNVRKKKLKPYHSVILLVISTAGRADTDFGSELATFRVYWEEKRGSLEDTARPVVV